MRYGLLLLVLIASSTPGFAQGPILYSVLGAADYSDGSSVGIPRGSIFTITGSGLASAAGSATGLPLPTTLNGLTVGIADSAVGGTVLATCPLLYVSPTQVNAILPSSLPAGNYYVAVVAGAFRTPSLPIAATNGRFAAFTQGARGFGPAVVQEYDSGGGPFLNQLTAAARPGSILVLWGTGLGALPSGSDGEAPGPGTLRKDVTIYVDGIAALPAYAGRAPGLPGVDQINVPLPVGVQPRCFVPLQVVTGGAASGIVTIAVSSGETACRSEFDLPETTLAGLDSSGVVKAAILRMTSTTNSTDGRIQQLADAWEAEYDTALLSVLAVNGNPKAVKGAGVCVKDGLLDRVYGQNISVDIPAPVITGASGCKWEFAVNGGVVKGSLPFECIASSYSFGGANGEFPAPRSGGAISSLSAQQMAQGLIAAWSANPSPADIANLTIGSYYTPFSLFEEPQTVSVQLDCDASVADTPFTIPPKDLSWALQYGTTNPLSLSLTTITDEVYPANSPLDIVLIRTANSVQAIAPIH